MADTQIPVIVKTAVKAEAMPTPEISVRPISPMWGWMDYFEEPATLEDVMAAIQAGAEPEWTAHDAQRWAIKVYVPGKALYEIMGNQYPSRGRMYYILPDAVKLLPKDLRPKA